MLSNLLGEEVFQFLILFVRVGAIFSLAPALGERSVSVRSRLAMALMVSLAMMPLVREFLPQQPGSPTLLTGLIIHEFLVGIFIAVIGQFLQAALHVAGTVLSFNMGLAFAQQFDPSQGTQSAVMASFFTLMGVALIFITDLHLLFLEAVYDSYVLFPPNAPLPISDMANMLAARAGDTIEIGVRLAAPFITYGLIFYTALGLTARLVPQFQIFFVALPVNILMGNVILLITIPGIMLAFLMAFEDGLEAFLN